jgi:HD-GYP domain-containing protein (c-di-GMP phosphodiesterase class II)
MERIVFCDDSLARLEDASTYQEKLSLIYGVLKKRCPGIDRISVALYDNQTRALKTFIAVPAAESPLKNYEVNLPSGSALREIEKSRRPRIVHDLRIYENHQAFHSHAFVKHGYASSYTHPIYCSRELAGFVFFNSYHNRYFRDRTLDQAEIFSHLIAAMIVSNLKVTQALLAATKTLVGMVQSHNLESWAHMERISRYSRLIARVLADREAEESFDDEQIEQLTLFAVMHDIGKIGIPEKILCKPSRLTLEEREIMNKHTLLGGQIVDDLISNFAFEKIPYIDFLRSITKQHHEKMDGSGYPYGLCGREISLAARIVSVCDIFDALTTRKTYKVSWSNEHAFAMLQLLSIDKLDKTCVESLLGRSSEINRIQRQFAEVH